MAHIEMEDLINILKDTVDDEAQRTNIYHDLINLFISEGEDDFEDVVGMDDAFDTAHDEIESNMAVEESDYDEEDEEELDEDNK
jgi:hypothetical protein